MGLCDDTRWGGKMASEFGTRHLMASIMMTESRMEEQSKREAV